MRKALFKREIVKADQWLHIFQYFSNSTVGSRIIETPIYLSLNSMVNKHCNIESCDNKMLQIVV